MPFLRWQHWCRGETLRLPPSLARARSWYRRSTPRISSRASESIAHPAHEIGHQEHGSTRQDGRRSHQPRQDGRPKDDQHANGDKRYPRDHHHYPGEGFFHHAHAGFCHRAHRHRACLCHCHLLQSAGIHSASAFSDAESDCARGVLAATTSVLAKETYLVRAAITKIQPSQSDRTANAYSPHLTTGYSAPPAVPPLPVTTETVKHA